MKRKDLRTTFEIEITITDIHLSEHKEILLYPATSMVIEWTKDGEMKYSKTPEESIVTEIPYLRESILKKYSMKSGNVYNSDNILRYKITDRWKKL
jgi:hypothetical protein